ncbi:hypothetical protein BS78_K133100 [Paspalum vaginatum]|uniref:Uncharacterized protein n=1 Tax=Paspalum vaginatum TaxID=158149 RepID=A0A9W7X6D8_9POAL|nr:hypothetical protein BS78_K133100 [Paspalum vaginatum]
MTYTPKTIQSSFYGTDVALENLHICTTSHPTLTDSYPLFFYSLILSILYLVDVVSPPSSSQASERSTSRALALLLPPPPLLTHAAINSHQHQLQIISHHTPPFLHSLGLYMALIVLDAWS